MDSFTLNALEFHKILDHLAGFCLSEAGQEFALLLHPMEDIDHIIHAQKIFDTYGVWKSKGDFSLMDFPNLKKPLALLHEANFQAEIEDFWAFREVLKLAKNAVQSISNNQTDIPELFELASFPFPELSLSALTRCVADDGKFKDESSPGLLLVRGEIRTLHQGCLRKAKQFTEEYNIAHYLQDDYITIRSDRYVLPLKANFKGRLQGIIHDYSHTGETLYFEPMFLVDLNNRLQELKQEEREEERKIIRLIMELITQETPHITHAWNFLVNLDINEAKYRLSNAYTNTPKKTNQNSPSTEKTSIFQGRCVEFGTNLNLLNAYHPLLLLENNKNKNPKDIRPIDLIFRQEDKILVISGGNAGGKTVALKTLGLMCLMSLSAIPVPVGAGSSMIPWKHIHAFIGDEQSLDDHVSTFTGQIRHIANVWDSLDEHHLLLFDEFGAGTDPAQGAALAQAVLDGIIEKNAYAVSATHFPALKSYALTKDHVRAASVLFNTETKKPLFYLAYDQIGSSQALDVAKEHGLAKSILDQASRYLLLDTNDNQVVMEKLNTLAVEREKNLAILQEQIERTKEKRRKMQEQFEKEQEHLAQELRKNSRELMAAWKSEKINAKQAMKEMATLRAQLTPHSHEEENYTSASMDSYEVGTEVMHKPWQKKALVQEIDEKNKRVKINIGGISMWVQSKDLATSQTKSSQESHQKNIHFSTPNISFALDLRGKRADLAINELTHFLDNALLAGSEQVEIIHGKGTGALRKCVHQFLKTYPNISSYSLATEEFGGDGMTLVYFK